LHINLQAQFASALEKMEASLIPSCNRHGKRFSLLAYFLTQLNATLSLQKGSCSNS